MTTPADDLARLMETLRAAARKEIETDRDKQIARLSEEVAALREDLRARTFTQPVPYPFYPGVPPYATSPQLPVSIIDASQVTGGPTITITGRMKPLSSNTCVYDAADGNLHYTGKAH